ncbi:MAG: hypothetical protein DMF63_03765 [Acidobacteria bacterium]|nr:MAG: hypothetical protein DMF63_03765 [Acidobacteriota bacterium]
MKNSKTLLPALAILLCVSLSCTFLKSKFAGGEKPADEFRKVAKLWPVGPNAPMVSPGAVAVRKLAEVDPNVASFASDIEAVERRAMKKVIAANSTEPDANTKKEKASIVPSEQSRPAVMAFARPAPVPASLMFQAGDTPLPGTIDGVFVAMLAGGFKAMIADVDAKNFNKKDSKTETSEGTTTTMDMELGTTEDGSSFFGMGMKTESTKNGVKVTTEMQAKIEGNDCPTAEGQVQITVKMRLAARSGGAGYTQDLTVFIRIQVDDNANQSATTLDITQATSRGKNGRETYVETGETLKYSGGDFGTGTQSNQRVIQKTDNATDAEVSEGRASGMAAAYGAAIGAIQTAESAWKGGKCIKIEATSPGTVEPSSGIEIPVKVVHRKEGSEIAAKLDATLSGETSIDPNLIPKTPGTLMYIAPGETGKSATIKLKATSRRGIAILDLTASTGTNSYRISGGLDDWYTDTVVCDITKPFTLTGGGIAVKFSGGLTGTYEYTGPFSGQGHGTYEMSFPYGSGKNGEMVGRGPGSVQGGGKTYHGSGEERYSLMTVDGPCVDGPRQ